MDYVNVVKNSFLLWTRDRAALRLCLYLFALLIVYNLLSHVIGYAFLGYSYMQLYDFFSPKTQLYTSGGYLGYSLAAMGLAFAYMLFYGFLHALATLRALDQLGFAPSSFGLNKYFRLILLWIWSAFAAILSLYSRKWMIFFLAAFALTIIGIVVALLGFVLGPVALLSLLFFGLASIMWAVYFFVLIYNSFRLSMVNAIFLSSDAGVRESAKQSWEITQGKFWEVFIAILLPSLLAGVISIVLGLLSFALGFGIGAVVNNFLAGLVIVSFLASIYGPFIVLIGAYITPSVYSELRKSAAFASAPVAEALQAPASPEPQAAAAPKRGAAKPSRKPPAKRKPR